MGDLPKLKKRRINLELLDCKPFNNGCVLVTHRVKR